MRIKIAAAGKIKQSYIAEGVCDYSRRLSKYCKAEIIEVKDEKTASSLNEEEFYKNKEGERLLAAIGTGGCVVCLDMRGAQMSSVQLADFIRARRNERVKELIFVIGGSCGLSADVLSRADYTISFSELTFPHGLMRLILLEQLYRAEKIIAKEPYHK